MEPSLHSDTLVDYLWEKWGVTDHDEALKYVTQWNDTVEQGATEVEFEAIFGVGYGKMGVVTDPEDSNICLLFGLYDVSIPYHNKTGAGRGGYAWQRLLKRPLQDDLATHLMIAERFALWKKHGRTNLIKMYNRMLEG